MQAFSHPVFQTNKMHVPPGLSCCMHLTNILLHPSLLDTFVCHRHNEQSCLPGQQPLENVRNLWHSSTAKGGEILPFVLLCACVTSTTSWWSFSHCLEIHGVYQAPRLCFWPLVGNGLSHHPGHPHHAMSTSPIQKYMMLAKLQPRALHSGPLQALPHIFHCCISIEKTVFDLNVAKWEWSPSAQAGVEVI